MVNKRAQTTGEYALLLVAVLASFVGMQAYVKRGINANLKVALDEFAGEQEGKYYTAYDPKKGRLKEDYIYASSRPKEERFLLSEGASQRILPGGRAESISRLRIPLTLKEEIDFYLKEIYCGGNPECLYYGYEKLNANDPLDYNTERTIRSTWYEQAVIQTRILPNSQQ